MNDIAIRVEGLGKRYRIGRRQESYKTLRDTLFNSLTAPLRNLRAAFAQQNGQANNSIWALKNLALRS